MANRVKLAINRNPFWNGALPVDNNHDNNNDIFWKSLMISHVPYYEVNLLNPCFLDPSIQTRIISFSKTTWKKKALVNNVSNFKSELHVPSHAISAFDIVYY